MGGCYSFRRRQGSIDSETECISNVPQVVVSSGDHESEILTDFRLRSTSEPNEQLKQRRKAFLQGKFSSGGRKRYRNSIIGSDVQRDCTQSNEHDLNHERRNKLSPIPMNLIQEQDENGGLSASIDTILSQDTFYTARTGGKPSPDPIIYKHLEEKVEELEAENSKLRTMVESEMVDIKYLEQRLESQENDLLKKLAGLQEEVATFKQLEERVSSLEQQSEKLSLVADTKLKTSTFQEQFSLVTSEVMLPGTPVSDSAILELARRIAKWKFLARDLKLKDHEIENIAANFSQDVEEQCYQMLKKWKQMNGNNADCATLGEALRKNFGETFFLNYVELVSKN